MTTTSNPLAPLLRPYTAGARRTFRHHDLVPGTITHHCASTIRQSLLSAMYTSGASHRHVIDTYGLALVDASGYCLDRLDGRCSMVTQHVVMLHVFLVYLGQTCFFLPINVCFSIMVRRHPSLDDGAISMRIDCRTHGDHGTTHPTSGRQHTATHHGSPFPF